MIGNAASAFANGKIGNAEQVCSARRVQALDGRGAGTRLLCASNGRLNFVLSESNALDILQLWHGGTNVGFLSKNGLRADDPDFLRSFPAGMLYTCGLDAIGAVEGHPPHGRFHSIPAEIRELSAGADGVRVGADIRDTALFGQNLVVTRTIECAPLSDEIRLTDRISNRAFTAARYCLLYHVNVGWPIVDAGARIVGDFVSSRPRTPWAEHEMARMLEMEDPVPGAEETCYFHETRDGAMSVENARIGKRFTVRSSLRKFVQWKSRASGDYVLGLEPCTSHLDGELTYSTLAPGASETHTLSLTTEDFTTEGTRP